MLLFSVLLAGAVWRPVVAKVLVAPEEAVREAFAGAPAERRTAEVIARDERVAPVIPRIPARRDISGSRARPLNCSSQRGRGR